MNYINENQVRDFYQSIPKVWPDNDMWHFYSRKQIENYIQKLPFQKKGYILNAGSGGNNYGVNVPTYHLDIAQNKIQNLTNATVGSIDSLPFDSETFTDIICVGSVLNYCDAIQAITEFHRVLKRNGRIIIEFESSWGFEHINNTSVYKKDAVIASLKYYGAFQNQWLYSYNYIKRILDEKKFNVVNIFRFHIISGLHFSKFQNENKAAPWARFDRIFRRIPLIKQHSNNIILSCLKL